jgi:uncharacterized protein
MKGRRINMLPRHEPAVVYGAGGLIVSVLWRRLDAPGHDACRLERVDAGWRLDGAATFRHEEVPACLAYRVTCDATWRTREGLVSGWVGARAVDLVVRRTAGGGWTLNGSPVSGLDGCVDLDLGFTPATNLLQIRRLALLDGQAADVPVAWLEVPPGTLSILHQRYERREGGAYWYEAPRFDYAAVLDVDPVGFPRHYPGLWEAEP